mgnify:CR=1 FL=1
MQQRKKTVCKRFGWGSALTVLAVCWAANVQAEEAQPAEIMPLAPKSLLLDLADTGENYVAVGERGHILLSADGQSWKQVNVPTRNMLTTVYFTDGNNGWAGGHDSSIVHTKDGGKTWSLQNWDPELEKPVLDVFFLDSERGFAIGAYGLLLRTFDAGQTWEQHDDPITEDELHFSALARLGDGTLLMAGEAGSLARSFDEGETWEAMDSPYEGSFFDVVPRGEKGAVVLGLRGNAFVAEDVTTATADSWLRLQTNTQQSFMGGTMMPNGNVALVGINGVVLVVSPDNSTTLLENPENMGLSGVISMRDGSALLTSGEGGTYIFKR